MKRLGYLTLAAVAAITMGIYIPAQPVAARSQAAAPASEDIDPEAIAALDKMGAYLRTLKAFQVDAAITRDDVQEDGQRIQYESHVDLLARKPDKLRVEIENTQHHRLFFYDGKTFTLFAQRTNYYATVPAPPTIGQLADQLNEKFGIEVPLDDLFYWGTERSNVGAIKAAMDVGPSEVGGVTCEQYAFRQEGLDWQIWIQQGDYPLPRHLIITTLTDDARPQYSSVLTWNLAPSFDDEAFQFEPPKDAQRITIAEGKGGN